MSEQQAGGIPPQVRLALRRQLLQLPLSNALRQRLTAAQAHDAQQATAPAASPLEDVLSRYRAAAPPERRLRAFAFDPSLATQLDTAVVNSVTIAVPWEDDLAAGPVGEYVQVVDVDPASGCAYPPVNLNDPALLAQDGLPQSEGNPQFHQQMVYAVAMKTIHHFAQALGRPIFWSPLRPWSGGLDALLAEPRTRPNGEPDLGDQFVRRLRLYPHALREANAYYDPAKRAILFGYFPAQAGDPGAIYPGGIIFTCLSHDIIAHEMTHAVLDGMHVFFTEPTNPDVFAFHEAFADIVALFQHFTYPEVLQDQIARTRGDLTSENLLGQLAREFGVATGLRHALRDAIGAVVKPVETSTDAGDMVEAAAARRQARATPAGERGAGLPAPAPPPTWMRYQPDPFLLPAVEEAHARGAILVAAVFDAFLAIYGHRVADLTRIATGGTGVLPAGELHPDLVNRMAKEAAKSAGHVLQMCIRAMDYVPPVDITFGEFVRALITADFDLVPDDTLHYRIAFIEAFRRWGIYPRDVRTLSEESLRWRGPKDENLNLFPESAVANSSYVRDTAEFLRRTVQAWGPEADREIAFGQLREAQARLNGYLRRARGSRAQPPGPVWLQALLPGIDLRASFSIANLRPARRIGPKGEFLTEMVFEVVQPAGEPAADQIPLRGGVTVIVRLDDWSVRYGIFKRKVDENGTVNEDRLRRQQAFLQRHEAALAAAVFGAAEYRCDDASTVTGDRSTNREAMRASSCRCRDKRASGGDGEQISGPFALLHRGRE